MDAVLSLGARPGVRQGALVLQHRRGFRPHVVAWQRAAELAVEVHRTAAKGTAVRAGLAEALRRAALRIPAGLALARLERQSAAGRRHLLAALRALVELESHLRVAFELLPAEGCQLSKHLRRANLLHHLIVTLALRCRSHRVAQRRRTSP